MKKGMIITGLLVMVLGASAQVETTNPVMKKDTVPPSIKTDTAFHAVQGINSDSSFIGKYKQDSMLNNLHNNNGRLNAQQAPAQPLSNNSQPLNSATTYTDAASGSKSFTANNPSWSPLDRGRVSVVGGQTYITSNNRAELITKDMTLNDGTVVMTDGTIKKSNGKKIKLKNGQGYSFGQSEEKTKKTTSGKGDLK